MIIPVFQPVGTSSHLLAAKLGKLIGDPTTHTGTLDPMAEGVLVCLTGKDRLSKEQHSNVVKKYTFDVLVGFSTDSHDLLGLVDTYEKNQQFTSFSAQQLSTITGEYKQEIPHFSAKRIGGESYFDRAKNNDSLPNYSQEITVHPIEQTKFSTISSSELLHIIIKKIAQVKGDFRQPLIVKKWKSILGQQNQTYNLITLTATTSKRTYIRGIVRDLSKACNIPLTTFHIIRTANGPYQIKDCQCLL